MTKRALPIIAALVALLIGCSPSANVAGPASAAPTPDFTQPGVAQAMVTQLMGSAGSTKALMVKITKSSVEVSVLKKDQVITWANRDGQSTKVASDLAYVDQATFDVKSFNFANVGALFHAAAGQSGSDANQSLTIVDYSGGRVMMSVSTQPESRTVFFNPNGSLMEVLDFNTAGGIRRGIIEAIGSRATLTSVAIVPDQAIWAEYPGKRDTTVRRARAAKLPVVTSVRSGDNLPSFSASLVNPSAIWRVLEKARGTSGIDHNSPWSVAIDDRAKRGQPRMYFTFGFTVIVTDMSGNTVSP